MRYRLSVTCYKKSIASPNGTILYMSNVSCQLCDVGVMSVASHNVTYQSTDFGPPPNETSYLVMRLIIQSPWLCMTHSCDNYAYNLYQICILYIGDLYDKIIVLVVDTVDRRTGSSGSRIRIPSGPTARLDSSYQSNHCIWLGCLPIFISPPRWQGGVL
jgi:hypothetical protein